MGRAKANRSRRSRVRVHHYRALPYRRPGLLVLSRQTSLAGGPDVYLSALGSEPADLVAIYFSNNAVRGSGNRLVAKETIARSDCRHAPLRWNAFPGARLFQRLPI